MSRLRWTAIALAPTLALGLSLGLGPAAQAGEPSTGAAQATSLDRFTHQPLTWHSCQTNPQDADGAALDQAGATCTDVTVPLDYRHPDRHTITVALSRIAASDTAHRIGPMIINLGGPGIPVLTRVADAAAAMGATGARFDLIGMDPRFVGRSSPLDCGWPQSSIPRSNGTSPASVDRMLDFSHDLANRCTANDRDPADPGIRVRSDAGPAREAALHTWADWAAARDATYHLGTTGADVVALINRIDAAAAVHPLHIGAYDVDDTVVPALLVDPLIDDDDASQDQLARFVSQLAQALAGTPVTPSADLDQALASILTGVNSAQHSEGTVISCADAPAPRSPSFYQRDAVQRRQEAPLFGGINRITPCAFWPFTPAGAVTIHNGIPALIVHADGDINATSELNQAMHQALTGSRLLTLTGVRTHGVYLFQGNPCIDDTVNAYLNTGTLPGQDATCTR